MKTLISILISLLVTGCGKKQPTNSNQDKNPPVPLPYQKAKKETPSKNDVNNSTPENPLSEVTPRPKITLAEAEKVAKNLQAAVEMENSEMVFRLIDRDILIGRAMPKSLTDAQQKKEIIAGARTAFKEILLQNLSVGTYQFLRVSGTPDGVQATMRLIFPNGGVNYHHLVLGHSVDMKPCVVDIFAYTSGEYLSQTFSRLITHSMPGAKLPDVTAMQGIKQFEDMTMAMQKGAFSRALTIYEGMQPNWKQQKTTMQMRIVAANQVAVSNLQQSQPMGDEYRKAMEDFRRTFPNAKNLSLLLIDFYTLNKDYKQARAAVDQLDKQVGGDPYLNFIRGNIALSQGKKQAGKDLFIKLTKDMPKNPAPYFTLIDLALMDKNYKEVTRLLINTEENTPVRFDPDFNGIDSYKDYLASPENIKWKAYKKGGK